MSFPPLKSDLDITKNLSGIRLIKIDNALFLNLIRLELEKTLGKIRTAFVDIVQQSHRFWKTVELLIEYG